jgi:polar amino acid transport system substrate-binding protein
MKRLVIATTVLALAAAALAALSAAAPSDKGPTRAEAAKAAAATRPPLPADVRARKRWIVGVKCDVPPFGYINVKGQHAGFDVEIARGFARVAFGRSNRVKFECAPTPAREPMITTGRVDLVISTFTYTADRDTRIDFSRAYYKATGRLMVKNESPITRLNDIRGKKVATTSGSIYDRWMKRCFPDTTVQVFSAFSDAVAALRDGRADAVMWDDTGVLGIATADRNLRLTRDTFLEAPYGIGFKQGDAAMKRWVDYHLNVMRKKDVFMQILRANVPTRFVPGFSTNILRPKNVFQYAKVSPETVCP